MEHFSAAWEDVKDNLVGWILYSFVFGLVVNFTFGVGIVLVPNFVRGIRDAVQGGVGPDISALFNFDNIADDAVAMLILLGLNFIGSLACGIGALVTSVLFLWIPHLAAEGHFAPADTWKVSLAHTKGNIGDIVMFIVVAIVVNFVGALACGLGIIVTSPVTAVAQWKFFEANRDEMYRLASQEGVQQIKG